MAQIKTYTFEVTIFNSLKDLSPPDAALLTAARKAKNGAYAPYSQFHVGAAVLMANGEIVLGSNQENASYPSGLCAERVAVFQAGARFPGMEILAIAVTASSKAHIVDRPVAPCGNCRQAVYEYETRQKKPIRLLLKGASGPIMQCRSIADILPLGFDASLL